MDDINNSNIKVYGQTHNHNKSYKTGVLGEAMNDESSKIHVLGQAMDDYESHLSLPFFFLSHLKHFVYNFLSFISTALCLQFSISHI